MIEKVNPSHPDKVADRIAGAIVDYAYAYREDPKIAVEVLIGHGTARIIIESNVFFDYGVIENIVDRIAEQHIETTIVCVPQDKELAKNQDEKIKCGDNGIFKGVPLTNEERRISEIAREIYALCKSDGKYILNGKDLIICQSRVSCAVVPIYQELFKDCILRINPLGDWTGGLNVDSGATNRKLGSDMAQSLTGGGLHGKDLSKADVSVNIYAFLKAQKTGEPVELYCAIGDEYIDGKPYSEIVEIAREYIKEKGGFEKFAEWGLF